MLHGGAGGSMLHLVMMMVRMRDFAQSGDAFGQRLSTAETIPIDHFFQLNLAQFGLIIRNRRRLSDITRLYLYNGYKLPKTFLNLASAPGKVQSLDRNVTVFMSVLLLSSPLLMRNMLV